MMSSKFKNGFFVVLIVATIISSFILSVDFTRNNIGPWLEAKFTKIDSIDKYEISSDDYIWQASGDARYTKVNDKDFYKEVIIHIKNQKEPIKSYIKKENINDDLTYTKVSYLKINFIFILVISSLLIFSTFFLFAISYGCLGYLKVGKKFQFFTAIVSPFLIILAFRIIFLSSGSVSLL